MNWTTHYEAEGVVFGEIKEDRFSYLVVADTDVKHYRITLSASDGAYSVGISAEWSDEKPGQLADYTPRYEYSSSYCSADEIAISDNGLLSVFAKKKAASQVDIRIGFTVQLPATFVKPLRLAVDMLVKREQGGTDLQLASVLETEEKRL